MPHWVGCSRQTSSCGSEGLSLGEGWLEMHQTNRRYWLYSAVLSGVCLSLLAAGCSKVSSGSRMPSAAVNLDLVTGNQLAAAVKTQKGKVLVVAVWASWCGPCKEEFPDFVALYQRRRKDGVTCMSVSLDKPARRDTAWAFLQSVGATFPNYLLDEGDAGWKKLGLQSIPAVFVFDQQGKSVAKFTNDNPARLFTYADVEGVVDVLLGQTPKGAEN
jgi:thiol-disulfide isomerase/thioredoxin